MAKTPQGNDPLDFEPANLPTEYLAALGLVSASASHTDSVIEMAVAGMLGIDGERGWAVTSHMSGPLRISALKSAAEIRLSDPRALDELDEIINRIEAAMGARNNMIHGSWCRNPATGQVFLVKQEARTHVVARSIPMTVDEIKLKAATLYEAGIDLMRLIMALDVMPALPQPRQRGVNTPKERKAARAERRRTSASPS